MTENNTGPAIPPENLNRIFEPFFTTRPVGKGTGLGLDTIQRIIQKHSGSVTVQSTEGATCFRVQVPIEPAGVC